MKIELLDSVYEELTEICLGEYRYDKVNVLELLEKMMDHPQIPMHYPYHHFILPAALLTAVGKQAGKSEDELKNMLQTAKERSKFVPPGSCGNLGNCGSGVAAGIFMSIFTDCNPHGEETWQWCNEITGKCLIAVSGVCGPRCCKRTSFLSLQAAAPYIKEKLGVDLEVPEYFECKYYEKNPDCKLEICPFYPVKRKIEIVVPDTAMPRLDPVNPCECQKKPVDLTYKKGKLHWLFKVGDRIEKDDMICEAEVEKKTIEFYAPASGVLTEILVNDGDKFNKGTILGYIEA